LIFCITFSAALCKIHDNNNIFFFSNAYVYSQFKISDG